MAAEIRSLDRQRRRKTLLKRIRYILFSVFAAAIVYIFLFSPLFVVKSISVIGSYYATQSEIVSAADIELGLPLARLNSASVAERVLKRAEIKEVEVRRAWPNAIVLAVVERSPIAVTKAVQGWSYVAADGVVFGHSAKKPQQFLSVTATRAETFAAAAKVAASLPDWLRERVVDVTGFSRDNVVIALNDQVEIMWGSADESAYKAKVLQALLGQGAKFYNVSVPDRPSIRK